MTEVTRVGASTVTDHNGPWKAMTERVAQLKDHYVLAGIHKDAQNAYGERIATYGYTQAGSRGSAPKWIAGAKRRADAFMKANSHEVMIAAQTTGLMDAVTSDLGLRAAAEIAGEAEAQGLRDTGALVRSAADFATRTHPFKPSTGTRRRGALGQQSSDQRLYQLFHKGRSRARMEMRKAVTFSEFKAKFGERFAAGAKGERATRAQVSRVAQSAQRAARSFSNGRRYYDEKRGALIRNVVLG